MREHPDEDRLYLMSAEEISLVEELRRGNEEAFHRLFDRYHAAMVRVAMLYVENQETAKEVAQDAWLGVLQGLDRFEAGSSLKTWLFTILTNRAKTRARKEGRDIVFSELLASDLEADESAVDPERFYPADHAQWSGHWSSPPMSWAHLPEERLLSQETMTCVNAALQELPVLQRAVFVLRDVDAWTSSEVCNILRISETNQRVLLHRARAKVRRALELYFGVKTES